MTSCPLIIFIFNNSLIWPAQHKRVGWRKESKKKRKKNSKETNNTKRMCVYDVKQVYFFLCLCGSTWMWVQERVSKVFQIKLAKKDFQQKLMQQIAIGKYVCAKWKSSRFLLLFLSQLKTIIKCVTRSKSHIWIAN